MPTILIVDDEADIREVIRFALEAEGFGVLEAGCGTDVLRLLEVEAPDLILLDWMLPGGSGLDLASQLRQHPRTRAVPIILVSARAGEGDRLRGRDTGADDYVTKPFSPRALVARVKALLLRSARGPGSALGA